MAELSLEPFAARLRWTIPGPGDDQAWTLVVADYLETLARRCQEWDTCVIGHIKAFAPLHGGHLRASTTGVGAPDVEASSLEPCVEIILTLNMLVYGLPAKTLAALATDSATELASTYRGTVALLEKE